MALSVIGAAYPRTGTLSLKLALEMLGFGPCHHMVEVITGQGLAEKWLDVFDGRPDWDAVFDGFKATVDAPACFYWRALADKYPGAKVILTERDPEAWVRSFQETVLKAPFTQNLSGPLLTFFHRLREVNLGSFTPERDALLARYTRHLADVKATIPKERLLVYRAGDGWEPLCAFLGVPVPAQPYPHVNEREQASQLLNEAAASDNPVEVFKRAMGRSSDTPNSA